MVAAADADELIDGFGRSIGLRDVAFDENGGAILMFDDILTGFRHDRDKHLIAMYGPVINTAIDHDADLYAGFLELSLGWSLAGKGCAGFNRDFDLLFFVNTVSLAGLEQERFNAFVKENLETIETWRRYAASGAFSGADKSPGPSAVSATDLMGGLLKRV
ncbi:hypothetical protein FHS82_002293 [Pseudochelatococcus lubricantis]|uniref:Uncharacterized protein n=1 Tax=Pseudochelatococcus lubricantis TaxID=1538102 RepID=A0ABX0V285_9HYPH|nr:CesT family type III secretion system chaperone [Pseudochelatococcus lubricantis]NIJ58445.1 hypothetical protein [Pseudochelatococcus lubricantis]